MTDTSPTLTVAPLSPPAEPGATSLDIAKVTALGTGTVDLTHTVIKIEYDPKDGTPTRKPVEQTLKGVSVLATAGALAKGDQIALLTCGIQYLVLGKLATT